MRARHIEVIQQAREIASEVAEVKIALVIVAIAIAASIPRNRVKVAAEIR